MAGKPVLSHIVEALPDEVTELVIVVGYLADQIKAYCGDTYMGRPVTYMDQADSKAGTGDALFTAAPVLHDRFLMICGDDIHGAAGLKEAVQRERCILAAPSDHPEDFGVIEQNEDGTLKGIVEKPENPPTNLVNTGSFVLAPDIFTFKMPRSSLGEYLLTDNVTSYAAKHPVDVVKHDLWLPIGKPEHIAQAEAVLRSRK